MLNRVWSQRISRAEKLSGQYAFAREILGFYLHLVKFQEILYGRLENNKEKIRPVSSAFESQAWKSISFAGLSDPGAMIVRESFPELLAVVERNGTERLSTAAREMRNSDFSVWAKLLDSVWGDAVNLPTKPEEFIALALLQPYAELLRSSAAIKPAGSAYAICPYCDRKAGFGVLRQQGDAGSRSLICGFCLAEWEFRRIKCPGCGQEDHANLPVYKAEEFPHIRVECCDICNTFIKSIDLTKNGLADPLVDELASIPLNLWAQDHGYAKLRPNLLGM